MRILVLLTDAFGGHGGIAKFNRDLLTALASSPGVSEIVAFPRLVTNPIGQLPAKLTYVLSGLGDKFTYFRAVLATTLRNRKFDLILCGHINLIPLASLCHLISHAPLALVIHGVDAWQPTRAFLTNLLVKRVDAVISVSEVTKRRFRDWTGLDEGKFRILPNCVDIALFGAGPKNPAYLRRYSLQDKVVIMTFGRLAAEERYKGFDEILEAMPALVEDITNLAYMIVGDGADRARLEVKAETLGVRDRVIFTGRIKEEEKAEHYRLADAYVMPSHGEGFGIVYLEAMACGIPVVASKMDGGREALRNGELGILTDPDDPEELKHAIRMALKRPTGVVLPALEYFSFKSFESRVHSILPLC